MTGSTKPRGPYAGSARRREEILGAAWDVFATQGFRGGSLREISQRLGYSQSGVIHHFGSKENLLLEVLEYRDSINAPDQVAGRGLGFLVHLRQVVRRNAETPGAVQLFVTMGAEAVDPQHPAHQYFVQRYRTTLHNCSTAFATAQLDGDLDRKFEPVGAARQLIAFLDGIQVQWLLTPDLDMTHAYDQYVREFCALYAVRGRTPAGSPIDR